MEKCAVCDKGYNKLDPMSYPPTCSKDCFWLWIYMIDHRKKSCWVPGCLEVYCGTRTLGYCWQCQVFQLEEEIKKRGLNKEVLIGNY